MKLMEEIKSILDEKRIPVLKLSKESGIPSYRIYKWIDGKAAPKEEDSQKLKNWLASAREGRVVDQVPEFTKFRTSLFDNCLTPLIDGPAAGTIEKIDGDAVIFLDYLKAPFIGEIDGAIEVTGDAMIPTFIPGSRIAIQRLDDPKIFYQGEIYFLIDANLFGIVRRMYEGEGAGTVLLVADNPDRNKYPAVKRSWNDIKAVFKVKADINRR